MKNIFRRLLRTPGADDPHVTSSTEPHPHQIPFHSRVRLRVILYTPIFLGILLAPEKWQRVIVAIAAGMNFLSIEDIYKKLRR